MSAHTRREQFCGLICSSMKRKFNSHDFTSLKIENPSSGSKVKTFSKYCLKYPYFLNKLMDFQTLKKENYEDSVSWSFNIFLRLRQFKICMLGDLHNTDPCLLPF